MRFWSYFEPDFQSKISNMKCNVFANALKKTLSVLVLSSFSVVLVKAQSLPAGLGSGDIAAGLKQALSQGVQKSTAQLSAVDGFFKDAAVKILFPPEAQKVEKTLRSAGFGKQCDETILNINRAAEDAAKSAA